MTHTPLAKGEQLSEMSTERLLLAYRRIKYEHDGSSIKVLESYLEEARRRDTERTQLQARIAELEAQLARLATDRAMPQEVADTIRKALQANRMKALSWTQWDEKHKRRVDVALAWLRDKQQQGGEANG